jgi:hypothetical protein
MLQELETALAARLAPMQDDGFRVLGAPTDHQQVGRVFGKGEIRVAYQSRTYQHEGDRIQRRTRLYPCTLVFEVVVELQDVQMGTHGVAAEVMEAIVNLIAGFNPDAKCGSGFYPIKDGFIGRDKEAAVWIYAATFGLSRTISIEPKGVAA